MPSNLDRGLSGLGGRMLVTSKHDCLRPENPGSVSALLVS